MFHLSVGVFGNAGFAKRLGKAGTVNDIAIYNHGSSEGVFTYAAVNSDKVQTLLQVVNMIDVPVFAINEITAALGEQIIAVDAFGFEKGFVVLENTAKEQLAPLIAGTCIEKFSFVKDEIELAEELKKIKTERPAAPLFVPIDNYFNVKSVGTVALGIVKSGAVRKHDKVIVNPLGREVLVKGIQSQDKDIDIAEAGTRVGLNLKGVEADELKRGYVVGVAEKSRSFSFALERSRYSKEQLRENDQVFVSAGLQVAAGKVKNAAPLRIETENEVCFNSGTKFLLASTKQQAPRIIGRAKAL